jgi:hypothetical protein
MFKFLRKTSLYLLVAPWAIFGLGCLSNQVVLKANQDRFPVMWNSYKTAEYGKMLATELREWEKEAQAPDADPDAAEGCESIAFRIEGLHYGYLDNTHVLMTSKTHFNFLADWIDLKTATYSIGDGMIELGEWLLVFSPFLFAFDVVKKLQKV